MKLLRNILNNSRAYFMSDFQNKLSRGSIKFFLLIQVHAINKVEKVKIILSFDYIYGDLSRWMGRSKVVKVVL